MDESEGISRSVARDEGEGRDEGGEMLGYGGPWWSGRKRKSRGESRWLKREEWSVYSQWWYSRLRLWGLSLSLSLRPSLSVFLSSSVSASQNPRVQSVSVMMPTSH